MNACVSREPLTYRDWAGLAAFSLALFLIVPLSGRVLTGHESVQPQTAREMFHDGDWIVPHMGGDPWLERPPVPSWFLCGVYAIAGTADNDAVARIAAILVAVPIVLLVAGIGSRLYGRTGGIVAGLICATMQEFYTYASNPEADIFLALIVTGVLAVFVRLEFGPRADHDGESTGFLRGRPWLVVAFFALLGATNLAKGVIFGTVMAGLPIAGYLLANRSWTSLRRYVWLWGWLLAAGVALAWPVLVLGRYPEILELWKSHYGGRLNQGYLQEPWWYYLVYLPHVIVPWTIPALVGLWTTRKAAFAGLGPERFLWCWAILPPAVFSLADGKHHHYLLQCLAPWALLSVVGVWQIWQWCCARFPRWPHEPLAAAAVWGGLAAAGLVMYSDRIPGGLTVAVAAGIFVPLAAFVLARSLVHPNPHGIRGRPRRHDDGIGPVDDVPGELPQPLCGGPGVRARIGGTDPGDAQVHIQFDWIAPLETFWMLYHTQRPADVIRDPWQLAERSPGRPCAYILTRRMEIDQLKVVGTVETVLESHMTRGERNPNERRVLCRVTFHPHIPPAPEEYLRMTRRTLW